MGPLILARGAAGDRALRGQDPRQRAGVHGQARARALPARGARGPGPRARTILVGSRHTAESLWAAMDDPTVPRAHAPRARPASTSRSSGRGRAHGPPPSARAGRRLAEQALAAPPAGDERRCSPVSAFTRDPAAAARALPGPGPEHDRLVAFVGKLIVSKGVDLLLAAWPLVLAAVPGRPARRRRLRRLPRDAGGAARRAGRRRPRRRAGHGRRAGRGAEGGPHAPLRCLAAFLDDLDAARGRGAYRGPPRAARAASSSPAAWSTPSWRRCWPPARRRSSRRRSPRRSGWSPSRRRRAARCRSSPSIGARGGPRDPGGRVPGARAAWLGFAVGDARGARPRRAPDRLAAGAGGRPRGDARRRSSDVARERFSWDGVARGVVSRGALGEPADLPEP